MKTTCRCLFKHAETEAERKELKEALEYARSIGDTLGTMMALARMGKCPKADPTKKDPEISYGF